jgi:hypothetical protein
MFEKSEARGARWWYSVGRIVERRAYRDFLR